MSNKSKKIKSAEKDRLILTISRIDHYYDSVNNKSAVYIAINTFVTGGLLVLITQTETLKEIWFWGLISLCVCIGLGIASLILLAIASIPFFSKEPNSLYYFGKIGSQRLSDFIEKSKNYTLKDDIGDLREQIHTLSTGLTKKFEKLKFVGILLVLQFIFLIPIIIFLIPNT